MEESYSRWKARRQQTLQPGTRDHHRLVALRACRDEANLDPGLLFQEVDVVLGFRGQIGKLSYPARGFLPAGLGLVHRLKPGQSSHGGRHVRHRLAIQRVARAYLDLLQLVQHIQLGDDETVEAVDGGGVLQQRHVEPAAAARPAGDRSEFVAGFSYGVAVLIVRLGGKRPTPTRVT